jgi:hypothetical protein
MMRSDRPGGRFDVDFARSGRPGGRLSWIVFGLGLTLLTAAVWHVAGLAQQRQQLAQRADDAARATAAARPAPRPAPSADQGARREASRVVADLDRPWFALLAEVDAAAVRPVRVNRVAVDSRFETVSIELESTTVADVLAFVQRLAAVASLRDVRLVAFEWLGEGATRRVGARVTAAVAQRAPLAAQRQAMVSAEER